LEERTNSSVSNENDLDGIHRCCLINKHSQSSSQYPHPLAQREQRDTNNTTRAAAAARARGAATQSIDREINHNTQPINQPTNQPTNQPINQSTIQPTNPTQPITILDVSLGSMVHSIEIDLIRS